MRGHQTLYICGTDEYGTATETKALYEGVTPREVCDKYHIIHKEIYDWFNIEFDHFGRTTTEQQTEFLADRFVTGVCPLCAYDDARGDQCDACGKLINAIDLIQPKCHVCKQEPKVRQSTHIFLHLDRLQVSLLDDVRKYVETQIERSDNRWSSNAIAIVKGWIKGGLDKRCITRDLKWGTPVPLAEFSDKVFYVWYDAPIGYLSITKCLLGNNWVKWWKNPENVELYNFVGKDNVAFHGVMFPSTQIGAGDNYTIVNNLCATEYLNYENTKFSKSRGTGVFGDAAKETGIEADVWRFYLLYMRPESQDTVFSWDDFALKVNSELLANLGNFVNRALSFLSNNFGGVIPEMHLTNIDVELLCGIQDCEEWDSLLDGVKLKDAMRVVLAMSRRGNQYMQAMQPWVLMKGTNQDKERAGTVIGVAANVSYQLSIVLHPFMPETGHKIGTPKPLFVKLDNAKIAEWKSKFGGASNKVKKMTPVQAYPHLAKNQQQIQQLLKVASIKFEQARALFVKNKQIELEACISKLDKEVRAVQKELVDAEIAAGTIKVLFEDENIFYLVKQINVSLTDQAASVPANRSSGSAPSTSVETLHKLDKNGGQPKNECNKKCRELNNGNRIRNSILHYNFFKFQVWETVSEHLKVSSEGFAAWKDAPLLVNGQTRITAPTLRGVFVK
uniref:methionine--tRNA ligase n=1 Tax=Heterorhabditis bacteriophora TaxID=37862 RepID=A0A1I7XJX3_HETBA